jgi:two-component system, LytTR family, response regulator LytT
VIRAVVMENEPTARRDLIGLLVETGKIELVGEAADGRTGLSVCRATNPDAVFLDVGLPWLDGLAVAAHLLTIPRPPLVVFATGSAGNAIDAFAVEAVDYLLRPLDRAQVWRAVGRLESRLGLEAVPREERLPVRVPGSRVRLVCRADVLAAIRRRRRTWIYTAAEALATARPLSAVAGWLGGAPFQRVARDAVVNTTAVIEVARCGDRRYRLRLADRAGTAVIASRRAAAGVLSLLKSPA